MCGICGFRDFNNSPYLSDANQHLAAMCREMKHRGPDDEGIYLSNSGVGLAAVRLSILDVAGGHQPIANEDGSCWVALNGEIYNFPDLKQELLRRGHIMRTNCDTEAIVHAYEEWGLDCIQHFDGMFTFALWDGTLKRLFMARDRMGKKPFYYFYQAGTFAFSSEIKSLLKHPRSEASLDPDAVDMYLTLGYIPGPLTIFKQVKKLLPGHWMVLAENQELKTHQYWDIPLPPVKRTTEIDNPQTAAARLSDLLEQSVKARLLSDVPVGVFLSGGLDSSLVTAMMRRHKPDRLKSFSVSFRDPEHNEAPFAKTVADHLGTDHYELATNECPPDLIDKLVWHCDEPLADPAIVPTYLVSKLAREQVTVVLTGEGADELFAGYFYYPLERQSARVDWMPSWVKQHVLAFSAQAANKILGRQRYHPRTVWAWQLHPSERMLAWMSIFTDEEKRRWFSASTRTKTGLQLAARHFRSVAHDYDRKNWLANFAYLDAKIPLVDDLLMKVDKMSMAASLEARSPFLDHRLVEYSAALPISYKLNNGTNKAILRQVAAAMLPEQITRREKHGFDVPIRRWLTEDLRSYFWDLVSSQSFQKLDVITKPQVQEIWSDLEKDVPSRTRQVWSLMILSAWCNRINS